MSADKQPAAPIVTETSAASSTLSSNDSKARQHLPDPALKWGITPSTPSATTASPKPETAYSAAEQEERAKLRAKGINPDLKAEMDAKVYGNGKGGIWNKVAGTAFGGGLIK